MNNLLELAKARIERIDVTPEPQSPKEPVIKHLCVDEAINNDGSEIAIDTAMAHGQNATYTVTAAKKFIPLKIRITKSAITTDLQTVLHIKSASTVIGEITIGVGAQIIELTYPVAFLNGIAAEAITITAQAAGAVIYTIACELTGIEIDA